ncbi:3-deoxy-D-manno-octulosonic acid transferase [Zhongshania aliphaticivorans]|uniref:3-deoxy-D-manno-octulosonic acid transferase n=1 Tax=Zhongshania aliphaticivorans TaxID=1470434 RepID=A0A5S9Q9P7_9GAMM|nr:lipid IV(A) 3-deoxy-D-manno-octulosonic acid transferase [Zhongshania aliphaticivorans]CAA0102451.1 3-deoxy-D-manno-octulosonic acid transferase [Zhongshania aliphaticivorans]CAA0114234.1 3-deoxy-D-manno-octulosonic acid transferase [Zhongshania aliphaticivorans]
MHILYTWCFRLALPLMLLHLWRRGRTDSTYRSRWRERFGLVDSRENITNAPDNSPAPLVWIHSASVGETLATIPLIKALSERHPHWQWLVTTTTPTGSQRVREALEPVLNERLLHYYIPFDLPEFLRPFINTLQPNILLIIETELWPNLLATCYKHNIPTVLVNGRLSAKSAKGYARFSALSRNMLRHFSRVLTQYPADTERFVTLGVPAARINTVGNIKFDLHLDTNVINEAQTIASQWRNQTKRQVWLAASTHEGEEEQVLDAYDILRKSFPDLLLVLVPRHPVRSDNVARLCRQRGLNTVRRSEGIAPDANIQVLLGDTMGELLYFYGACDVAFMGGSLVPIGGHNMIEPAAWGVPTVSGPHLHNFSTVSSLIQESGGLVVAESAQQIANKVAAWLKDKDERIAIGDRAQKVVSRNNGALARTVDEIEALVPSNIS